MSRNRPRGDEEVLAQARNLNLSAKRLIQDSRGHLQQLAEDRRYVIPSGFVAELKQKISEISKMIENIVDIESSGEKFQSLLQQLMDINEELHSTMSAFISDDRTVTGFLTEGKGMFRMTYCIALPLHFFLTIELERNCFQTMREPKFRMQYIATLRRWFRSLMKNLSYNFYRDRNRQLQEASQQTV